MQSPYPLLGAFALALLAGCSTPDSRIAEHRAAFERFPEEVQRKIRAGQVDVGFTPEMVLMALGEPDRKYSRQSAGGATEVWGYVESRSHFSFGIGVGTGGRHSSVGGGVAVSTGGYAPDEKMRVEFRDGKVSAIDAVQR